MYDYTPYPQELYTETDKDKALKIFKQYLDAKRKEKPATMTEILLPPMIAGTSAMFLLKGKPMAIPAATFAGGVFSAAYAIAKNSEINSANRFKNFSDKKLLRQIMIRNERLPERYKKSKQFLLTKVASIDNPISGQIARKLALLTLGVGGSVAAGALITNALKRKKAPYPDPVSAVLNQPRNFPSYADVPRN